MGDRVLPVLVRSGDPCDPLHDHVEIRLSGGDRYVSEDRFAHVHRAHGVAQFVRTFGERNGFSPRAGEIHVENFIFLLKNG